MSNAIHRHVGLWRNRVEFCERHLPHFNEVEYTDDNHGSFRVCMFTVLTQHLYGLSVTELIDRGIEMEMNGVIKGARVMGMGMWDMEEEG